MDITITDKAVSWFEKELLLEKGDAIRFFGKTYGSTEVHEGFSVGMSVDQPEDDVLGKTEVNGITYFAGTQDDWFFNRYNLEVDYDEQKDEPIYHFNEN
ncbi:HesB/YadR/YfhF family protein [Alkalibacterium pelagium]|jgi:uncharacterized protein YneR|uniref:Uncharacterized protein YneR n=1 Tax=Alkalibacterium pelagium TaxID=426702 RepID=A0A1H7PQY7_9LACT|nr:iron-sulfur cluster biosynthesis protein [Alkalibacterium pelagium]GEN51692.1 iron-sulfur cluster biosynthesis protein [Alkalibacterium pelagium]SEL37457.1 Uncharacterized protein YneR [Alkalibacterium pelagium]